MKILLEFFFFLFNKPKAQNLTGINESKSLKVLKAILIFDNKFIK